MSYDQGRHRGAGPLNGVLPSLEGQPRRFGVPHAEVVMSLERTDQVWVVRS